MIVTLDRQSSSNTKIGIYYRPENTLDAFVLGQAMTPEFNVTVKRNEDSIEWLMIDPLKLVAFLGRAKPENANDQT